MTHNLRSIQSYLGRKKMRRDAIRAQARKWSVLLMTGNATGMIVVVSYIAKPLQLASLERFYQLGLATAALAFAGALVPSIMGAFALGVAPADKALSDGPPKESKELTRNLMIGGVGFIIGLASVIGVVCSFALGVIAKGL